MNGELAHAIGLALHGSAWLADPSGPPPGFDDGPSSQYLRRLGFTAGGRLVADGPAGWFRWLQQQGVRRIGLLLPAAEAPRIGGEPVEEHLLVAFAGAGRWALVTSDQDTGGSVVWPARWSVGDQGAPDHRIWDVTYEGQAVGPVRLVDRPVLAAAEDLRSALQAIEAFARVHSSWWVDAFTAAIAGFSVDEPVFPYYPDAIPDGLGLQRRRLAAVAAASWVFGGMGTWNDQSFPDPDVRVENDRVTAQLYRAVLEAFVTVVNAG